MRLYLLRCHVTARLATDTALQGCLQSTDPTTVCTSPFLKATGWPLCAAELQCSTSTPAAEQHGYCRKALAYSYCKTTRMRQAFCMMDGVQTGEHEYECMMGMTASKAEQTQHR